jgi:hypothetical protein
MSKSFKMQGARGIGAGNPTTRCQRSHWTNDGAEKLPLSPFSPSTLAPLEFQNML